MIHGLETEFLLVPLHFSLGLQLSLNLDFMEHLLRPVASADRRYSGDCGTSFVLLGLLHNTLQLPCLETLIGEFLGEVDDPSNFPLLLLDVPEVLEHAFANLFFVIECTLLFLT